MLELVQKGHLLTLLLVATACLVFSTASIISLTKDPPTIKPILTKKLSVRCDLKDTQVGGGLVGKRSGVAQTSTNIKHLISLVVLRNGVDIASITRFTQATGVGGDQGILNVTGELTDSTGYLQLNWTYPGETESGNVTCKANGIDANGHGTIYATSTVVGVQEPSLSDLVRHIHAQEIRLMQQDDKISDQSGQISQLTTENQNQRQQIAQLMNRTSHIEVGLVNCGDSSKWTESPLYSINKPVRFSHRYEAPPTIHLSAVYVDQTGYKVDYHTSIYELYAVSVTEEGFTLRCKSQAISARYRWDSIRVSWASYPKYSP